MGTLVTPVAGVSVFGQSMVMGNAAQALYNDLVALRANHADPAKLGKDASDGERQARDLHQDAVSHLDNALDALRRSLELGK